MPEVQLKSQALQVSTRHLYFNDQTSMRQTLLTTLSEPANHAQLPISGLLSSASLTQAQIPGFMQSRVSNDGLVCAASRTRNENVAVQVTVAYQGSGDHAYQSLPTCLCKVQKSLAL